VGVGSSRLRPVSALLLALGVAAWALASPACLSGSAPEPDAGRVPRILADAADAADAGCKLAAGAPFLLRPTGSYGIGRGARQTIVDPVRDEPETPDPTDKRKLSIETWYPTDPCATGGTEATYLDPAEAAVFPGLAAAGARTHARLDLPMVADGERHPVLLFSPGYSGFPRAYSLLIEGMVSHGYVVVTISHTFWNAVTTFADGTTVAGDHAVTGAADADAQIKVWIDDQKLVLDALLGIDASDGKVGGRLDLDKIGGLGHSFGGATALRLMASDPRMKVAVNLDGTVFGIGADPFDAGPPDDASDAAEPVDAADAADAASAADASDAGDEGGLDAGDEGGLDAGDEGGLDAGPAPAIANPFLLFRSDRAEDPSFTAIWTHATGTAYELVLEGTTKNSFTDVAPVVERSTGVLDPANGPIDPVRASRVINAYLVAFFAQHLSGQGAQELLAGPSPGYPDILFQKRP
jgi:dienelactone hydrolase